MNDNAPQLLSLRKVFLAFLFSYVVCVSFRFMEAPLWNVPFLHLDGEPLLATHDAYAWVAGAKGTGRYTGAPMSVFIAFLHSLTGMSLGTICFWLPVFAAPLVVVPVSLIMHRLGHTDFAALAGILAGGSFGFLLRTRIGFGDTDVLTLFLPLLLGAGLILWASPLVRTPFAPRGTDANSTSVRFFLIQPILLGLLSRFYMWFYPSGYAIAMSEILFFGIAALWFSPASTRKLLLVGLGLVVSLGMLGWVGTVVGTLAGALLLWRPELLDRKHAGIVFILLVIVMVPFFGVQKPTGPIRKLTSYIQRETETADADKIVLPSVVQSVRESQRINWDDMARRNGINWYIFIPALAGVVVLFVRYPLTLTFLPLLFMSLAAFKLGNRFSMYGGPVLGMGLGVGLSSLLILLGQNEIRRWLIQLGLCLLVAWPVWSVAKQMRPTPVLPSMYAQTFKDVRKLTPLDSQLWQWWDYGYAAQYYAERKSFGDGGKHAGPHLYPLGVVHSTHFPLQASQMIKFIASSQQRQLQEQLAAGNLTAADINTPPVYFSNDPIRPLKEMTAAQARDFVKSLASEHREWPQDLPEQYLVFSWENLRLGYWISYFGNWNLETGQSVHGSVNRLFSQVQIDTGKGILTFQGNPIPLASLDLIDESGSRHLEWPNHPDSKAHAIANSLSNEVYLMDDLVYDSMMVQMLLGDPAEYSDQFELVLDRYPWNRVYKVR